MELSDQSIAMARRVGDASTLATVLVHRCWSLDGPDDVVDQLDSSVEVVDLGEELGDREMVLQGLRVRLAALLELGDFDSAGEAASALTELASELRHPEYLRLARMWDIVVAAIQGRYQEAEGFADELHGWLQQIGHPQSEIIYIGQTFSWRWLHGRAAEYLPVFEAMGSLDRGALTWPAVVVWCCAELALSDRVHEILQEITPQAAAAMDKNYLWWGTVVGFAHATAFVRDREWARVLYDLALPFADRNCTLGLASFLGAAAHHLGVLAGVLGRWDDAAAHLDAALQRHQAMRARPYVALTQQAYADVLVARDGPGDRERARDLHQAALRTADELGLKAIEGRAKLEA